MCRACCRLRRAQTRWEVLAGSLGSAPPPGTSPRLRVAVTRHPGARLRDSRLQVGGRVTGRGCLGCVLLGPVQLGDGSGQGDELGHERDGQ